MIELTLREMLKSEKSFEKIIDKPFNASTAFQIARMVSQIKNEYAIYLDAQSRLVEKYNIQNLNENQEDFQKEFTELLNSKITLNANKLKLADFEGQTLTPYDLELLMPFIEE